MTTLVLSIPTALAGNKNQNDITNGKSVERGTGKINGKDGCAPPTQSGEKMVYMDISLEEEERARSERERVGEAEGYLSDAELAETPAVAAGLEEHGAAVVEAEVQTEEGDLLNRAKARGHGPGRNRLRTPEH